MGDQSLLDGAVGAHIHIDLLAGKNVSTVAAATSLAAPLTWMRLGCAPIPSSTGYHSERGAGEQRTLDTTQRLSERNVPLDPLQSFSPRLSLKRLLLLLLSNTAP